MNGKSNYKLKSLKIIATIHTMFVRLSEYIHFVHSQHETQDKCILIGVL